MEGQTLVNIVLHHAVHLKSPISHAPVFLFNVDPSVAPFSLAAVVKVEHILDLRCNATSTTYKMVYWVILLQKRDQIREKNLPAERAY